MEIVTDIFGTVTYEASEIINFQDGLYGFEAAKQFIIIPIDDTPYKSLQSIETEELAFTITTPFAFYENYDFEVPENVIKQLEIEAIEDLEVYSIIVLHEPMIESTMNMKAPLFINVKKGFGKQFILNEDFPLRYKFLKPAEA